MKFIKQHLFWFWLRGYVFIVGAVIMSVEVAAFRLYTPIFGGSIVVWGSIIGTVMAALAVGYWVGGRLSQRPTVRQWLLWLGFAAAGYLLLVSSGLKGAPAAIAEVSFFSETGSLAVQSLLAAVVLFAVPMACFGAVTPLAIHIAVKRSNKPGRETGRIYALSTAGSILGTFFASFVLLPFYGTDKTILASVVVILVFCFVGIFCKMNHIQQTK